MRTFSKVTPAVSNMHVIVDTLAWLLSTNGHSLSHEYIYGLVSTLCLLFTDLMALVDSDGREPRQLERRILFEYTSLYAAAGVVHQHPREAAV